LSLHGCGFSIARAICSQPAQMSVLLWILPVPFAAYLGFKIYWARLRVRMIQTTTILPDLPKLSLQSRLPGQKIRGAAIVAGGRYDAPSAL
jgi:hypothetical protein